MPKQKRLKAKPVKAYDLIIVAHPDDEAIFLGGLLLSEPHKNWKVICVTDGNADGMGKLRHENFQQALKKLGVKQFEIWNFKDIYTQRLPIAEVVTRLLDLPKPKTVYTHGVLGEYGHPHHQDVSIAAHKAFAKAIPVWSVAYNCYPQRFVKLNAQQFQKKCDVLSKIYFSETQRFSQFLPVTSVEGFVRVRQPEVEAIYRYWTTGVVPEAKDLKVYRWYWPYIEAMGRSIPPRPF